MDDIKVIYNIVKSVIEDKDFFSSIDAPPIFSFEGLPGAGKTTQIKKASLDLESKYGKAYYIDLPTSSSIGLVLKSIYADQQRWNRIRIEAPWMNPLLLSIDLQLALKKARQENAGYVLMSRGILSTYYYNMDAYLEVYKNFDTAWKELSAVLKGFARPAAIIFFELPAEEAHKRVVERNRGPLREMDKIENMTRDRERFEMYMARIDENIPIHYIDAGSDRDSVTGRVDEILSKYLGEKHE